MIVGVLAAVVIVLLGWRVRPQPAVRARSLRWSPNRRWLPVLAATAVVVRAPIAGLTLLATVAVWRRWSVARRTASTTRRAAADYPDALDLLVLTIRAGYLPAQAMVEVVPFLPPSIRGSFAAVDRAMRGGARFADALGELHDHLGPMARALVDSLSAADRYGLPLAPVLERLAFEARQQRRRDADASARELPVRMAVPLVLCTLPSFVLLAIVPLLLGALSSLRT